MRRARFAPRSGSTVRSRLRPEAVDMQTTEDRLIARYRLAGFEQAGAFTPRPQAPADSLLSIQVHESMLNNIVVASIWAVAKWSCATCFSSGTKLQIKNYQIPEDVPEDVTIELAAKDAILFAAKTIRFI